MVGDALEDVPQVAFGIQLVELRGTKKAVDRGGTLATIIGAGEQPVFATQSDRA
jgi:hypothetical protein